MVFLDEKAQNPSTRAMALAALDGLEKFAEKQTSNKTLLVKMDNETELHVIRPYESFVGDTCLIAVLVNQKSEVMEVLNAVECESPKKEGQFFESIYEKAKELFDD